MSTCTLGRNLVSAGSQMMASKLGGDKFNKRIILVVSFLALCALTSGLDLTLDTEEPQDKECHGTNVFFGYSGTLRMHYEKMQKRFTGCHHVIGNLEITNLYDPFIHYDLHFLKDIRYVSGSVLIGLVSEVTVIPLLSLEVIRGNSTYFLLEEDYSLVVAHTEHTEDPTLGLQQLQLPALREVSRGKVLFIENPSLGYVDSIHWTSILRGREQDVHFKENACNTSVLQEESVFCSNGPRWGDDPELCQTVGSEETCAPTCQAGCFGPEASECCHDTCAVGCAGPGPENCVACKDYFYDDHCVGFCPDKSYPLGQVCVQY